MKDELKFPKKQPQKYIQKLLKIGIKSKTTEYISWEVEKKHYDNFNSISKEKRNEILTLFRKGGISIGEVGTKLKIPSEVVGDVIYLNIKNISMLRQNTL